VGSGSHMKVLETGKYLGTNKNSIYVDGIIISETIFTSKADEGWHSHENNHLSFLLKGGSREQRKRYEFEEIPGTVTFYNRNEPHRNLNIAHSTQIINVEIEPDFIEKYQIDFSEVRDVGLDNPESKFTFLQLFKEANRTTESSTAGIHILVLNLLSSSRPQGKCKPDWMLKLIELLHDRWDENINLSEMADILGVHPVTLSRYFPKYFNSTLGEYIRNIRIEKAISLVTSTDLSLIDVAYRCSFFDQSHFIRCFKNKTGFLPNKLRKTLQG
jgi:AraC family transcriptional regulator